MTGVYMVNGLLFVIPCILLLYLIFRDQIKIPRLPVIFASVAMFLMVHLLSSRVYLMVDTPLEKTFVSIVSQFAGVFIFSTVSSYTFGQSLFIITVVKNYSENVRLFSYQIYFLSTGRLPEGSVSAISCIMAAVSLALFPLICWFYKKLMRPALDYSRSLVIWKLIWVIPISNTIIYTMNIAPDTTNYSYFPKEEFLVLPALWCMMTFMTYGIFLRTVIAVSRNAELQEKLHLTEVQITAQQKYMEDLQMRIQETRRYRHDIRHHFLVLGNLAKSKDLDGLQKYLEKISAFSVLRPTEIFCENTAVNALLGYYKEKAEKEQIKMTLQVSLFEKIPIADTEVCIILGNLLENAIEACRRMESQDRSIDLELTMVSSTLLVLLVQNSYEGVVQRAQDGTFLSAKTKGRKGIGLSSVLDITERYNGVLRFEYKDQIFKVSLLLNGGGPKEW